MISFSLGSHVDLFTPTFVFLTHGNIIAQLLRNGFAEMTYIVIACFPFVIRPEH